jgi:hypothetical protein
MDHDHDPRGEPRTLDELMHSLAGLADVERGERISQFFRQVEAPRWRSQGYSEDHISKLWVLFMRKGHGID